jgi:hypothetical protein
MEKEISYFVQSKKVLPCSHGLPIGSALWSIPAGLTFMFIYLRSILIQSAPLRIFTPSVVFSSGIPGKVYVFISYLSGVPQLHPISSSVETNVWLHPLFTGELFSELFDEKWWLYFQRAESSPFFGSLKIRPLLSLKTSVTNYPVI